jgi:hypothetical protein
VTLLDRFFGDDFYEVDRLRLLTTLENQTQGKRRIYFDIYDVDFDFDSKTVTIYDDLDPESKVSIPFSEFKAILVARAPSN